MRYSALACDYDGTIAQHGRVDPETLAAFRALRETGRKLILVTGRELEDLRVVCPELALFDVVVAENGALLYRPDSREEEPLGPAAPEAFVLALRERGVEPLSVGRVIVATWEPNEQTVLDVIRRLGLELQVIFNKGAVMVLPAGVNKRTGLKAALDALGLSFHNCVGLGDAENDHAFLSACECSVAVANALDSVKETADFVTQGHHGTGVRELVQRLLEDDLRSLEPHLERHHILLGTEPDGRELKFEPYGAVILVAGVSGGGKSTVVRGLLERVREAGYQTCLIDPEGDYDGLEGALRVGSVDRSPDLEQLTQVLQKAEDDAVVNLLGVRLEDRPQLFVTLFARLSEMRSRSGRPHWLVVDEAHHMLHRAFQLPSFEVSQDPGSMLLITVHPDRIHQPLLERVSVFIAVGAELEDTLRAFAAAAGAELPALPAPKPDARLLVWDRREPRARYVTPPKNRAEGRRHLRKYAEGELGEDKSFYFRGPENKLNLRAQNLVLFNQIAEGIDDETWKYHLENGDIARWFEDAIKDSELAAIARKFEKPGTFGATSARRAIRQAIEMRYTLPAR